MAVAKSLLEDCAKHSESDGVCLSVFGVVGIGKHSQGTPQRTRRDVLPSRREVERGGGVEAMRRLRDVL